jgi:hypothetical protein
VCPTILNQQCKYCKKNGHTPKHCPELKGKYMPEGRSKSEGSKPEGRSKPEGSKPEGSKPEGSKPEGRSKPEGSKPEVKSFKSLAMEKDTLHDNFPVIGEKSGGRIIRPTPMKLNVWAEVVKKAKAEPAAQAPEEQAPEEQAPEEQAPEEQAPEEQAPEEQAPEEQAPEIKQAPVFIPQDYSKGSWADYD